MENIAIEELLSSFGSDAFAIQPQPEKDLRATLLNFFSVQHDPNGTNHLSNNTHSSPVRFLNQTNGNPDVQTAMRISSTCSKAELPPSNTPIGSPMKEDLSTLVQNPVVNYEGNYINMMDPNAHCLACLHSVSFNQDYSPFPHAQNCHHSNNRFNNNNNNHHPTNELNPSDNLSKPAPYQIDGFRPSQLA